MPLALQTALSGVLQPACVTWYVPSTILQEPSAATAGVGVAAVSELPPPQADSTAKEATKLKANVIFFRKSSNY